MARKSTVFATLTQQVKMKELIEANSTETTTREGDRVVRKFNEGWTLERVASEASTPDKMLNIRHANHVCEAFKWYFIPNTPPTAVNAVSVMRRLDEIETTVLNLMDGHVKTSEALADLARRLDDLEDTPAPLTANASFEEWAMRVPLDDLTVPAKNFVSWFRVQGRNGMAVRSNMELKRYVNGNKGGLNRQLIANLLAQADVTWGEFIKFRSAG